ncbi:TetR/AcrR family transcriptional regulator [Sedimenticola selenatireducens]|uniref:TetR family transcriptional regulator n=1 Tax=Sedimenticola selenatireducens TaxID=191960 RepID=A0A2N6D0T3_9GAMM|nr:TetR/AcrR family transcriptional regulator [Sedimenticola selenatireducens]PLX63278.1 MAG: TetR family transcriptional regulator [Sedimenticola selenatireducens]
MNPFRANDIATYDIGTRDLKVPLDTKDRILDVAEEIFAEKGYSATSMRTITSRANVNLAAVNYHFGSKAQLYQAVFQRRVAPMNRERIRALESLERKAGDTPLELDDILRSFVEPALKASMNPKQGGINFIRLLGRTHAEPGPEVHDFLPLMYDEVKKRYRNALAKALPDLSQEELSWRVHFVIGTIAFTLAGTDALEMIESCRYCDPADIEGIIQRLLPFLKGGLSAPSALPDHSN